MNSKKLPVVTLRTFALGKLDLLKVYRVKSKFKSVTDFSRGKLPGGRFYLMELEHITRTIYFTLTVTLPGLKG